jgi:hypothetical protein
MSRGPCAVLNIHQSRLDFSLFNFGASILRVKLRPFSHLTRQLVSRLELYSVASGTKWHNQVRQNGIRDKYHKLMHNVALLFQFWLAEKRLEPALL